MDAPSPTTVIVTGGAGFIGRALISLLSREGYQVIVIDLVDPKIAGIRFVKVDLAKDVPQPELFEGVGAVIHLAGKNIFGRWTKKFKKELYDSRIKSTAHIVSALARVSRKPKVFISASAIGYYGDRGNEILDEESPPGNDFLARLVCDWEHEASMARSLGIRDVSLRTAPVLGRGGILGTLYPFFRYGLGTILGPGTQWFSWIHIEDLVNMYLFALSNKELFGPINASSPNPVPQREFAKRLGQCLKRPVLIQVPRFALRGILGELADSMLASERVSSKKIYSLGFRFRHATVDAALSNILPRFSS